LHAPRIEDEAGVNNFACVKTSLKKSPSLFPLMDRNCAIQKIKEEFERKTNDPLHP
jgi:hypothetical protein